MDNKLGQRIKFFRKRAGMSQLELENAINASPGMVSRIENGQVNPTKESVRHITDVLNLNNIEVDYLIGNLVDPASQEEIDAAKDSVKEYFEREDTYAYLSDDRWRVFYFSRGFRNLFNILLPNNFDINKLENISLMRVLIDDSLCIRNLFDYEQYEAFMRSQIKKFYNDMGFMEDSDEYVECVKWLQSDPITQILWNNTNKCTLLPNIESRTINFCVNSLKFELSYFKEPLYEKPRFLLVEYKINDELLNVLLGIVK